MRRRMNFIASAFAQTMLQTSDATEGFTKYLMEHKDTLTCSVEQTLKTIP